MAIIGNIYFTSDTLLDENGYIWKKNLPSQRGLPSPIPRELSTQLKANALSRMAQAGPTPIGIGGRIS